MEPCTKLTKKEICLRLQISTPSSTKRVIYLKIGCMQKPVLIKQGYRKINLSMIMLCKAVPKKKPESIINLWVNPTKSIKPCFNKSRRNPSKIRPREATFHTVLCSTKISCSRASLELRMTATGQWSNQHWCLHMAPTTQEVLSQELVVQDWELRTPMPSTLRAFTTKSNLRTTKPTVTATWTTRREMPSADHSRMLRSHLPSATSWMKSAKWDGQPVTRTSLPPSQAESEGITTPSDSMLTCTPTMRRCTRTADLTITPLGAPRVKWTEVEKCTIITTGQTIKWWKWTCRTRTLSSRLPRRSTIQERSSIATAWMPRANPMWPSVTCQLEYRPTRSRRRLIESIPSHSRQMESTRETSSWIDLCSWTTREPTIISWTQTRTRILTEHFPHLEILLHRWPQTMWWTPFVLESAIKCMVFQISTKTQVLVQRSSTPSISRPITPTTSCSAELMGSSRSYQMSWKQINSVD